MTFSSLKIRKGIGLLFLLSLICLPQLRAEEIVIVGLGDSTTAGTPDFISPSEMPPAGNGNPESQYAYWLMKKNPEWKVLNRGIRGQRSDQIMNRFELDVMANRAKVVIVLAGVNDLFQGRDTAFVKKNLERIYQTALEKNVKVLACTILPYDISPPEIRARMDEVNEWIRRYAAEKGLGFCDTFHALENRSVPHTLLSSRDHIHPDAASYKIMAEAIEPALSDLLKKP